MRSNYNYIILLIFAMLVMPLSLFSEDKTTEKIRIAWYQDSVFQNGTTDSPRKSGYNYEIYQKISDYTGWLYEYVYGTKEELLNRFAKGEIDIFADTSAISGYNAASLAPNGKVWFMVNPWNLELLRQCIQTNVQLMNDYPGFYTNLDRKYLDATSTNNQLSDGEKEWINKHKLLRIGYYDNYMPFSATSADGTPTGVLVDIIDAWQKALQVEGQLQIELVPFMHTEYKDVIDFLEQGKIDAVFPFIDNLWYCEQNNIVISRSIVSSPIVAVYNPPYSADKLSSIASATSAMQYVCTHEYFPESQAIVCKTRDDCLDRVLLGEIGSTLFNATRASEIKTIDKYKSLEIMPLGITADYGFGVRKGNTELLNLLNHGLALLNRSSLDNRLYDYATLNQQFTAKDFFKSYGWCIALIFAALIIVPIFISMRYKQQMLKQRTQQEKEKAEAAEAANQAKTSFLFNMSHDIRTPMNAIIGFTNLMRMHQDEPEKREDYLNKIESSSEVLLSIINNVLEMARIEKGTVEIVETAWSAEQFNDTLYSIFNEMMVQKGITFTRKVVVNHPYVLCDSTKLREIFINILSNAYKYTKPGGKVHMLLDEVPSQREGYAFYRTSISDTGIGMSEEFLPHLFDEFSRENNVTDSKIEGTGLGMPIVKKLVDMMNGTIEVKSQKGVGTTFVVTIPHKITDRSLLTDHAGVELDPSLFKDKRILLAEDNDLNAEIAVEILSNFGFKIDRAEDGAVCVEMLEKAETGYYDIILMDIQMPNMNGYEATRTIRLMPDKSKSNITILAMTANAFEEDKHEAASAGMNGHLSKPINLNELMKTLAIQL